MRLVEEKKLVIVEIVLLVFVVLTGIGVQFCTIKADEHTTELLGKISELSLVEVERTSQKVSSLHYLIGAYANANVEVDTAEVNRTPYLDPEFKQIVADFASGEISKLEYMNRLSVKHNDNAGHLYKDYVNLNEEKMALLNSTPIWSLLRYLLFVVQFLSIMAAIFVYFLIYQSISRRTK